LNDPAQSQDAFEPGQLPTEGVLGRLERRYEQTRHFARDIEDLFRQLLVDIRAHWPADAQTRYQLSVRAYRIVAAWAERARQPQKTLVIISEIALSHIAAALLEVQPHGEWLESLVDAWDESGVLTRDALAEVMLNRLDDDQLTEIEPILGMRGHERRHVVTGMLETMQRGGPAGLANVREVALLQAKILGTLERYEEAVTVLEQESTSAPAVLVAWADVYEMAGQLEDSADRLRRAAIVQTDKTATVERLAMLYHQLGDSDAAVEQLVQLLGDTGELGYWDMICDLFDDEAGAQAVQDSLATEHASLHASILIAQGDYQGVLNARSAKTFSFEQLWRIGRFLEDHGDKTAARIYERAITLQGATAHSKADCQDLGARIESVMPFFEQLGKTTKPRRIARELLKRQKTNVPLKREMERIFGAKFS
jgi:tetratricopeptide (TPR) repeat protein